jgi:cardiolipin synthase (CMP-forming)
LRHIVPWWLVIVIVARDLILGAALIPLRRRGYAPPEVHYLGKAATFCLLYAFLLLVLGAHEGTWSDIARPIAWAFTIWGTGLYLWSGAMYLRQTAALVRGAPDG